MIHLHNQDFSVALAAWHASDTESNPQKKVVEGLPKVMVKRNGITHIDGKKDII